MLRVTALPSSYGSHRAREHPRHGWEGGGWAFFPWGRAAAATGFGLAPRFAPGESPRGEYLELGGDVLSLAALVLAVRDGGGGSSRAEGGAARLVPGALTAWPQCAGADLHAHPRFPPLFYGLQHHREREGGAESRPPPLSSASPGSFAPHQPTALGRAKITFIQLEVFGSTTQAPGR